MPHELDPAAVACRFDHAGGSGTTLAEAIECFNEDGVIVLRDAVDPEPLRRLGAVLLDPMCANPAIRRSMDILDWEARAGLGRYDLFRTIAASGAMCLLRALYKTDALLLMEHNIHRPRVQFHEAPAEGLPFHQDGGACGVHLVRGWFLLSPERCGDDSPNMEFLVGAPNVIMPIEQRPKSTAYGWIEMDHAERDQLVADCRSWKPVIDRGDIAVFIGTTPHRTNYPAGGRTARLSLETSIFPNYPAIYDHIITHDPVGLVIARPDGFEHIRRGAPANAVAAAQ